MNTVNMNELIAAGVRFNIVEEDVAFDEDGELIGYSEVGESYFGDDRVEMEFNPLCDTAELSDDAVRVAESKVVEVKTGLTHYELIERARAAAANRKAKALSLGLKTWRRQAQIDVSKLEWERVEEMGEGRWAHVADADKAERDAKLVTYHKLDVTNRPWREMQTMAEWRKDRWVRQLKFVDKCFNEKTLRKLQQGAWKKYLDGVKRCVVTGDWWAQYLTKFEMRFLSDLITEKRAAIRAGLKAPKSMVGR